MVIDASGVSHLERVRGLTCAPCTIVLKNNIDARVMILATFYYMFLRSILFVYIERHRIKTHRFS